MPRLRVSEGGSSLADRAVQVLPAVVVLVLAAFMVEREGGFGITVWAPVALVVLGLAVTVALSAGSRLWDVPRTTLIAIGCFAGFVGVAFASIGWAAVRGDAWTGSNKALLYLVEFALLAAWPIAADALWPVVLGFGLVVCAEGVWTVEQIVHSSDPSQFTIGTRLSEPLGYPNATAALFMIVAWLMLGLATRTWLPTWARGLAFGLTGLSAALNLLTESRGSVFTLPLVVIVYFAIVPGRLRSAAAVGLVALAFLPMANPVLDVYSTEPEHLPATLSRAIDVALVFSVLLGVAGALFAFADRRWTPSKRVVRGWAVALIAAVLLGLGATAVATTPWNHVGDAWRSFKDTGEPSGLTSHFGGLGSARYDFWRVGLIEFERHPVAGIGMDNFVVPYVQQRRSEEQPSNPHSLFIRLLSQTGILGTLLFAAFLVCALGGVLRIPAGRNRDLARILVVGFSVWLLHGLVDWLWEMPVLGVIAVGLLGLACGLAPRRTPPGLRRRRSIVWAAAAAGGLVAVVAGVSLALPWLAERQVQAAASGWRTDPSGAFSALDRARSLDPLSDEADLIGGAIASRLHRYTEMRLRYAQAVGRSPDDWYANLELGIAASLTNRPRLAASALARARELNPRDEIVRNVVATFRAGRPIDSDAVDRAFESS